MADVFAQSFGVPNYSGMLFNKGNTRTPFSTMIGARRKYTNHVQFACGQYYTSGSGSQPAISETASLTAPDATVLTRTQFTNVCQIYQQTLGISYAKMSNMGTLGGINVAGQQPNPMSELDFQVAARMEKIGQDIEYTFLNGAYNLANSDATINKTRGLVTAITTNVVTASSAPLDLLLVIEAIKAISDSQAPTDNLVLGVKAVNMVQLNADAAKNGLTIVPSTRTVNGIAVNTIVTPFGEIGVRILDKLADGVAVLFDPSVMAPVEMIVPEKGNFFVEPLAQTGAGIKYQIFGQIGLDHGPEWYSAKITGLSTSMPTDLTPSVKVSGTVTTVAGS